MTVAPSTHILYHFQYSIRSLFVRYTYAIRGPAANPGIEIRLREQHVDLRPPAFDQLEEKFICDINPSGEVPVLVSKQDGSILPDSRAITFEIAKHYHQLMPEDHIDEIHRLLAKLHEIDFYSLTFTGKYMFPCGTIATLLERRNHVDTSDRYRQALDRKIDHITGKELPSLKRESAEHAIVKTIDLLQEIDKILKVSQTDWILNTTHPTALDAHVIVFVARLKDADRGELVPARITDYADKQMDTAVWEAMVQGQGTVPPGGF